MRTLVKEADRLLRDLFPVCRSITGNGVRDTLRYLKASADFRIVEISSGTVCYDWKIPDEWNIKDAYIEGQDGKRIADFSKNNLHVVSYSVPVDRKVGFRELEGHLHYIKRLPDAVPYRTSYYNRSWGFCLSYNEYRRLDRSAEYRVFIDSSLKKGSLTYGEGLVKGTSGIEYIISTYCCHPSTANDNLSGMVLWALLLKSLRSRKTKHSYRFVIAPETIGSIAYLNRNESAMRRVSGGFVITTVAGPGRFGYKRTFLGDDPVDSAVRNAFRKLKISYHEYPFDINGSDEKQYSSPFFRIPVGTICKDKYFEYDEYHTSLDNLSFISARDLVKTLDVYIAAIDCLEKGAAYRSTNPRCSPMLGKRGLYPKIGGHIKQRFSGSGKSTDIEALNWMMFYGDGSRTISNISEKTGVPEDRLNNAARALEGRGLLARK
jgi:aminopeptidase-like protein